MSKKKVGLDFVLKSFCFEPLAITLLFRGFGVRPARGYSEESLILQIGARRRPLLWRFSFSRNPSGVKLEVSRNVGLPPGGSDTAERKKQKVPDPVIRSLERIFVSGANNDALVFQDKAKGIEDFGGGGVFKGGGVLATRQTTLVLTAAGKLHLNEETTFEKR